MREALGCRRVQAHVPGGGRKCRGCERAPLWRLRCCSGRGGEVRGRVWIGFVFKTVILFCSWAFYDLAYGTCRQVFNQGAALSCGVFHPDGLIFATAEKGDTLQVGGRGGRGGVFLCVRVF